jgi:hypothetical protein
MASKCLEEFNPWPSFVDIFSAVILVLLLFLLVLIVNVGYYAQFKFKVQYDGSVVTDKIILDDTPKILKVIKEPDDQKQKEIESSIQTTNMDDITTQAMQDYLTAATDIESAGEDLADKKKEDKEQTQNLFEEDRIFYIKFNDNEIFIEQQIIEKLKLFVNSAKEKYPNSKITLYSVDPNNQVSLTVTKQISLGRILSTKTLLKKFDYNPKDIKLRLSEKQIIPEDIQTEAGLIVVKITQ